MLKLFSVKDKQKQQEASAYVGKPGKLSAGELRIQKDMAELNLPPNIAISFPDGKDKLMHFHISIRPDEGIYRGGKFIFDFAISAGYPHDAPKVLCTTKAEPRTLPPTLSNAGNDFCRASKAFCHSSLLAVPSVSQRPRR
ncbi:NEDD8-conjugating enzyme Ubc12 [Tetrabaena socialis]|uniref:NEDD8-conjugating enzyme Ubc12 n=1 Tax=Tetrabaena socialis TaxID=47790 RepID=A0A2J8A1Z0_9CHLO|nr:NEDD8-conjugating enzyme Ubc12 [Tetrabaena socialis]|eukprot:PNH06533.1 NEDD8-conjugating enzyme Ubc12 [Tetrabaena socialis]